MRQKGGRRNDRAMVQAPPCLYGLRLAENTSRHRYRHRRRFVGVTFVFRMTRKLFPPSALIGEKKKGKKYIGRHTSGLLLSRPYWSHRSQDAAAKRQTTLCNLLALVTPQLKNNADFTPSMPHWRHRRTSIIYVSSLSQFSGIGRMQLPANVCVCEIQGRSFNYLYAILFVTLIKSLT